MRATRVDPRGLALGLAVLSLLLLPALAQETPPGPAPRLLVGIKDAPPFVLDAGTDAPRGLSIDLVRELAARLDPPRRVEFRTYPDVASHLAAVERGEVDLGIAATTITAERERRCDFSLPFLTSGLGIVTSADEGWSLGTFLLSREVTLTALAAAAFVLVSACTIWWTERSTGVFDRRWHRGIPQAIWWTVVTMSTVGYGDFAPRRTLSRGLAVGVIFAGIALFGIVIAQLTAALTVQELRSTIRGVDDLSGKTVAVVAGTSGAAAMARRQVRLLECRTFEEGLATVREGRAAALVHDLPLLRHRLKVADEPLALVKGAFRRQDYGIAFPHGSPLREPVNVLLLELKEDDDSPYPLILQRWLGEPTGP